MFIHLPNTSKQRATGSLLTLGARGGRCSKIINSNACFSIFPLKFQGLLTPPPNSSMQKQPASLKTPCCQDCRFSLQSEKPKDLGSRSLHPQLSCLHQKKLLGSTSTSQQDWEGSYFHAFSCNARGKIYALQKTAGKFEPCLWPPYKSRFFIKA